MYIKFPDQSIYSILLNIFISLIGGALISLISSLVAFCQIKKEYEIRFVSQIKCIRNLLGELINWFTWRNGDINFELEKSIELQKTENDNTLNFVKSTNDNLVDEFVKIVTNYSNYDFDKIYFILDDYCSLNLFNRNNSIRILMYDIMEQINKYNLLYDIEINTTLTLYKQKIYNSYIVYTNVIQVFNERYKNKSKIISNLNDKIKCYFCKTKIEDYTKKLAPKKKELTND